jgi:serine/threonine-protein kinase
MILDDGHVELAEGAIVDGRLRIVEDLARGSMSSVYLARELESGRDVVLKILGGKYATRADARPRLLAEEQYTAALADKPGIVRVLSTGALADEGDAPYLVLEYVDGPTLTGHVAGQSTDVAHVLTLLAELAGIVADVHAAGIVHRDLKPENVLVAEREGEVVLKLTDIGLATRATDAAGAPASPASGLRLTGDHDRPGTHHYMAPEQCVGGDVGTAADIYALGVSAFELLVGEPPWGSRTGREVVIRKCDPTLPCFAISDLSLGLPAMVVEAIDAALQREPGLRPTASGFRDAMRAGASEVRARPGAVVLPPVRVSRGRAHTPKRPMPAAAAGGAAVTGVPAARSGTASAAATMRLGRGRMDLVVPEVTRSSDLELRPAAEAAVVTAAPAGGESASVAPASVAPASAASVSAEPVVRQRRAHPERHVEVTELSPRAGAIVVAGQARARSGDTEAVLEVPSGMTEVIDRAAVEQAIARASAAAKLGEPLGPAIEVERETYAERDASRAGTTGAGTIAAPATLDRGDRGRRGWRWVALLGVLSVAAALRLWWVDGTVRTGEGGRDDVGGGETRPAAIASDEPGLVERGNEGGGPRLEAVDVKPDVPAPPPNALHPVPAPSSIEDARDDTRDDAPPSAPAKPVVTPRPKPTKPDPSDPLPSPPVAAVPMHETPACEAARSAVSRAASSGDWDGVLNASKNRKCWSDSSTVAAVRVRALLALARHEDCVREGKAYSQRKIVAMVDLCRERSENR